MAEPSGHRGHLPASWAQLPGGGVPHPMRGDVLGGARWPRGDGALDGRLSPGSTPIARERRAAGTRHGPVRRALPPHLTPGSQHPSGVGPEGPGPRLAPLPHPRDDGAVITTALSPRQGHACRASRAPVVAGPAQRLSAPSPPRRSRRRCQEGLDCGSRQRAEQVLVRTRPRPGEHAGHHAEAVGSTQGHQAATRAEGGHAARAGSHGVPPLRRTLGAHAPPDGGLDIGPPHCRRCHTAVVSPQRPPYPDRVATAAAGVRTEPSLRTAVSRPAGRHLGCHAVARQSAPLPRGPRSGSGVLRRAGARARP